MNNIDKYIKHFISLRRDMKIGGAPHKPILLLSVIQLIENNYLTSNQISLSPQLVSLFKKNWSCLVNTEHHMIFCLPFYYMKSEPFWKLIPKHGCEKWVQANSAMKTFSNLHEAVEYAEIDLDLFLILKEKQNSFIFKKIILDKYFPETKNNFYDILNFNDLDEIAKQIVEEASIDYKLRIKNLKLELDENEYEQEIFLRSSLFQREIIKLYDNTCSISGLRIDATINTSILDACHIVPFSISYDDSVTNGISLCPNLHRAFDRGLIGIDEDYRVIISDLFIEPKKSSYSIIQFAGHKISLPKLEKYYPSQNNLKYHRNKFNI